MALLDACNPRLITVDDSCGCTLTRASITPLTATAFEALGALEIDAQRIIGNEKELRKTGVIQKGLKDLLLSRMVGVKQTNIGDPQRQSVIAPFFMRPQRHNVNSNYWKVTAGAADPAAGTGTVHAGSWQITVENESGLFATPLVDLQKYFLPQKFLIVLFQSASTLVGRAPQFKITASANADAGGVEKALITLEPPFAAATWAAMSAEAKAVYQPTAGIAINLANSISNYESYCNQYPAEVTTKLREFWFQTIRNTWCYTDAYLEALNAPLTSEFWKKFRTLPLAQQRKRQGMQEERDFFNTVFYGQAYSDKQTQDTFTQLPQVIDPATEACVLEYKANTLGIRTQLQNCGKVIDHQGMPLDLDLLRELGYSIKRNREIDSGSVNRLDVFTDRFTFGLIRQIMLSYYKAKYGYNLERFWQQNQRLSFQDMVLWEYDIFEFPEDGFELAVFRDTYFDDHLSAFPDAYKSRGRQLWVIDWSDIEIGLAGTKSVQRQTNVADNLYNCVITPNVSRFQLMSKTIAVIVQDPNRHVIFENFSGECPELTVDTCVAAS